MTRSSGEVDSGRDSERKGGRGEEIEREREGDTPKFKVSRSATRVKSQDPPGSASTTPPTLASARYLQCRW